MDKAIKSGNEIKVNMVHKERRENFDGLLPGGEINNWIFKVVKVEQVDDGSAAVVLSLHCKSFVGSGQVYSQREPGEKKTIRNGELQYPMMIVGLESSQNLTLVNLYLPPAFY